MKPKLLFTVTNDLVTDQRMVRICNSLALAGYEVSLIGAHFLSSPDLSKTSFKQLRIHCRLSKGKLFYIEYNIKLFLFLLRHRADLICAVDLDTIMPVWLASGVKRCHRVYDAHELFCEMKEIVERPTIYRFWKAVERNMVPSFVHGYTVNQTIAEELKRLYGVDYAVIRNLPVLSSSPISTSVREKTIIYQGAVNEGRCFETLIPAMKKVDATLHIYGTGNFFKQTKELIIKHGLAEKVILQGRVPPIELRSKTQAAKVGVTLFESNSKNNYWSLGNRFFDYMHAGIPQLCVNYPEYQRINNRFRIALLIDSTDADSIADGLNRLLSDRTMYDDMKENCKRAMQVYNWQSEEKQLIAFYHQIIPAG
jgi:glycosyltransferase involved in cell wall biosynthesis